MMNHQQQADHQDSEVSSRGFELQRILVSDQVGRLSALIHVFTDECRKNPIRRRQSRLRSFIKHGIMGLVRRSQCRPVEESQEDPPPPPRENSHHSVLAGLHVAAGQAAAFIKSVLCFLPVNVCFSSHRFLQPDGGGGGNAVTQREDAQAAAVV